jgi:hypothetical protein
MREALAKLFKDLEANKKQFRKAIWKNAEHDEPVTVTGELGRIDGKRFYSIKESAAGICEDELEFEDQRKSRTKHETPG